MTPERIQKLSDEACGYVGGGSDSTPIEEAIRTAVRETLVEAVAACEQAVKGVAGPPDYNAGVNDGAASCQAAIRKLQGRYREATED